MGASPQTSVALIRHYREKSLTSAAMLAALATARSDRNYTLDLLKPRQDALITEQLHDFAFAARKFIELSSRTGISMDRRAEEREVPSVVEPEDAWRESDGHFKSLWFLLGRVIHSEEVSVDRSQTAVGTAQSEVTMEHAWGFYVRSDHDRPGIRHFVFLEYLLESFVGLEAEFARQLDRLGAA